MWVVCYDIGDDYRRARVAGVLQRFGLRSQESVFECPLDREGLGTLEQALARELARSPLQPSDSIRMYRVCEACVKVSRQIERRAGTGEERAMPCVIV